MKKYLNFQFKLKNKKNFFVTFRALPCAMLALISLFVVDICISLDSLIVSNTVNCRYYYNIC